MPLLSAAALEWMHDHHGLITAGELRRCGIFGRDLMRLVADRQLLPLHKGVYRIASSPFTLHARCAALCMAHPKGFVTGPTAGRLRGLRRMPADDGTIHFCVPHGLELRLDDVVLRQSCKVDGGDVQIRSDGIVVASPWRLAFDLSADLGSFDHASVIEQILHERLCGVGALRMTARRLAHPARRGSKLFVETLANRIPGGALESHPEVIIAKALRGRGVPICAQVSWLELPNGSKARLDVSVPPIRWGVEVDVHPDHLYLEGTTKDKRRDRQTRLLGWQVDRVTGLDLLDIDATIEELLALYHLRCSEVAANPAGTVG